MKKRKRKTLNTKHLTDGIKVTRAYRKAFENICKPKVMSIKAMLKICGPIKNPEPLDLPEMFKVFCQIKRKQNAERIRMEKRGYVECFTPGGILWLNRSKIEKAIKKFAPQIRKLK